MLSGVPAQQEKEARERQDAESYAQLKHLRKELELASSKVANTRNLGLHTEWVLVERELTDI